MAMLSEPAFGPKLSIGLIVLGALMEVWTLVWRYTLAGEELTSTSRFWYLGFLLTGATFLLVGFFLGNIGRAARRVELPPPEATRAEEQIKETAAANPPAIAAGAAAHGLATDAAVPNAVPGAPAAPAANVPPVGHSSVSAGTR